MDNSIISQLLDLLSQYGVKDIICSPGSRNAALLMEADRRDDINKHVVVDERTAAFIGLGMALVSRNPVALICTSGTALLNYGPALAEAYYQGIPLIAISADRPVRWINQDDSQTIDQQGVFSNFIKGEYDLNGSDCSEENEWYANRIINEALTKAMQPKCGPVHLNIHLEGITDFDVKQHDAVRKIDVVKPPQRLETQTINSLAETAAESRIMIVAGFMQPDNKLQKAMLSMNELPNVCIMAETVSNLHLPQECFMVDTVLFPLTEDKAKALQPDLIISLGGALISRKLKEFLRNCKGARNWDVGYSDNIVDCFQSLTLRIECEPASFMNSLAKRIKRRKKDRKISSYSFQEQWNELRRSRRIDFRKLKWSDLKALQILLNALPRSANLFLSNGTSVRYGQIIPYPLSHSTYSNRGVSGIEGSTSTAIGGALIYDKITCLITGDMSFGYDIGGLASEMAPANLRIVVLDNGGGDIFRFINATKNLDIRERYLSAERELPVGQLAEGFGFDYYFAESEKELKEMLEDFFEGSLLPKILHVSTKNGTGNSEILTDYLTNKTK